MERTLVMVSKAPEGAPPTVRARGARQVPGATLLRPGLVALGIAVLAYLVGGDPPALVAQEIVIADCPGDCTLPVREVASLGGRGEGVEASLGGNAPMVRLSDGRWVIVDWPTRLLRFSPDGRFEQVAGRAGQGPGEFGEISFLFRVGEDSILVADPVNFRLTTLDRDLRVVSMKPVPGMFGMTRARLGDGTWVAGAQVNRPSGIGLPLHFLDTNGSLVRSFGASPPIRDLTDSRAFFRALAPGPPGRVWAAHFREYRLEEWGVDGTPLRTMVRRAPWFPPARNVGARGSEGPPDPTIRMISRDDNGLLWAVIWVAGENWADGLGPLTGPDGRASRGPVDISLYWDSVIEVIDPEAGRVVGRARIDYPVRAIEAGFYSYHEFTDELEVRVRIVQVGVR